MDAPRTGDRCFSEQKLILSLPCTTSNSAVRCPQKPLVLCQPHMRGALTPASGGGGSGAPSPASSLQGGVSGLAAARGRTGAGSHLPAHPAQGGGDNALFPGGWGQRLGKWGRQGSRPGRQVSPGRLRFLDVGEGLPASWLRLQPWPLPETVRDPACRQSQLLCTQGLSFSAPRPGGTRAQPARGPGSLPSCSPAPNPRTARSVYRTHSRLP